MNLNAIAGPICAAVNPDSVGTIRRSTGYTTDASGVRTPTFSDTTGVAMQFQALSARELQQIDNLNLQGVERAVYVNGQVEGVDRAANKGGDLLIFGASASLPAELQNTTWLVAVVFETWDVGGWCKVGVTKQRQ